MCTKNRRCSTNKMREKKKETPHWIHNSLNLPHFKNASATRWYIHHFGIELFIYGTQSTYPMQTDIFNTNKFRLFEWIWSIQFLFSFVLLISFTLYGRIVTQFIREHIRFILFYFFVLVHSFKIARMKYVYARASEKKSK